ncbi:MAG: RNA polymerase sigma factor [Deltaproteobacteria bacterium]
MTDEKLVELCKQGEEYAFEILIQRYHQHLHNFIFNYVENQQLTEDIVQETFIKMIKNINTYKLQSNSKFSTWLFTIARNTITDEIRKGRIRETVSIDDEEISVPDSDDRVEDIVLKNEAVNSINTAIDALSPELKSIVILKYYMDFSYKEISEIVKSTPEKVKGKLHYAIEKIRKKLGAKGVNFNEQ